MNSKIPSSQTSGQSGQGQGGAGTDDGGGAAVPPEPIILSYMELRKAVGFIGFALPVVLAVGNMILQGPGLQDSISSYYYTDMGNVFVGSMCAVGVFLLSYKGYERADAIAGTLAGIFAVCVALFPTTPAQDATPGDKAIGMVHLTFAALLFLTLAYFSLFLFTKSVPNPTDRKRQRNKVYIFCGWTIVGCIVVMAVAAIPQIKGYLTCRTLRFWFESIAIVAFGVSWLIKGETILKDQNP